MSPFSNEFLNAPNFLRNLSSRILFPSFSFKIFPLSIKLSDFSEFLRIGPPEFFHDYSGNFRFVLYRDKRPVKIKKPVPYSFCWDRLKFYGFACGATRPGTLLYPLSAYKHMLKLFTKILLRLPYSGFPFPVALGSPFRQNTFTAIPAPAALFQKEVLRTHSSSSVSTYDSTVLCPRQPIFCFFFVSRFSFFSCFFFYRVFCFRLFPPLLPPRFRFPAARCRPVLPFYPCRPLSRQACPVFPAAALPAV